LDHLFGYAAVIVWVDTVEAMCNYAEGRNIVFESSFVSFHVDAKGQATDDDKVGESIVQFFYKTMDKVASVLGALTCADNADDMFSLKVDVAELEKNCWGIGAIEKTFGVSLLAIDKRLDVMSFDKLEFALGIVDETCVLTAIKHHLADGTCLEEKGRVGIKNGFGRTKGLNEVTGSDGTYATDSVQNQKRDEGVHVFVGVMAAIDGCDWDA
jgi:hypothetical protein